MEFAILNFDTISSFVKSNSFVDNRVVNNRVEINARHYYELIERSRARIQHRESLKLF